MYNNTTMLEVKKLGSILEPTKLEFENLAVLNPGVYQDDENVHVFYRAINKNHESCIGYAKLKGPTEVVERWAKPIIERELDHESKGVEDPRIVKIEDTFYMTYVAHDGKNAVTAYATSTDLKHFEKRGVITPRISYHEIKEIFNESQLKDTYRLFSSFYEEEAGRDVFLWEKDVVLFPEKIKGRYALLHRTLPDIQITYFNDFTDLASRDFWTDHFKNLAVYVVLENKHWFETRHIGGGAPPVKT
ncbi:MAG: pesticidal protein Cry7Aa, partial [Patescibacteria group bacterium]